MKNKISFFKISSSHHHHYYYYYNNLLKSDFIQRNSEVLQCWQTTPLNKHYPFLLWFSVPPPYPFHHLPPLPQPPSVILQFSLPFLPAIPSGSPKVSIGGACAPSAPLPLDVEDGREGPGCSSSGDCAAGGAEVHGVFESRREGGRGVLIPPEALWGWQRISGRDGCSRKSDERKQEHPPTNDPSVLCLVGVD